MKKLLVFLVGAFTLTVSFAQSQKHSSLRLGFNVDPSIGWLHPNDAGISSDGSKVGINFGFMLENEFSENYFFTTGLQINHTGGKLHYEGPKLGLAGSAISGTADYNIKIEYLEIPFALKLRSNNLGNNFRLWGSMGGYLGVPLLVRNEYNCYPYSDPNSPRLFGPGTLTNNDSKIQPINLGASFALGVEYPLNKKNILTTGLAFNNGLIDITKNNSWNDGKVNLNSISLKLGIFF